MLRKLFLVCGLVVMAFLAIVAGPVAFASEAEAPPPKRLAVTIRDIDATLQQNWYGVYGFGKKMGFLHMAVEKVMEDDQAFYRFSNRMEMKMHSLGTKGEMKMVETQIFSGTAPFALHRGEYLSDDGKSQKRILVTRQGKGYEAVITIGKVTQKENLDSLDYTLADAVATELWMKKSPATGDIATVSSLDLGELRIGNLSMRMLGTKEIDHDGAKVTVGELEKIDNRARATERTLLRFDRNGVTLWASVAGVFEMKKESEAAARKTEFPEDMIMTSMAKLDRAVGGELNKVQGLTLRGQGDVYNLLPQTALQSITKNGDTYTVKIGKHHGAKIKATDKEIRAGLEASSTHPRNDPKIVAIAKKAIGDAKTDQEKTDRLCKFVHEYIKYEIVNLPKVYDILERKVGDCKSYALLFACLARAVDLPAREVAGYFYMGDEVKGFGGHAWNEVLINGCWIPVDATLGLTDLPPFYICVGRGPDCFQDMSQTFGKLSFELVHAEMPN